MDWTAVFHEDGEEELQFLIEETLNARAAPRLARLVSSVYVYSYNDHGRTKDKSSSSPQHAHEPSSLLKETKNVGKAKVYWGTNVNGNEYEYENAEGEDLSGHRLFELTRTMSQEEAVGGDGHGHDNDNANANAYTLWALYCLTINYILGVGCLGVPYAFARAGFILCGGIIIVVSGISYITVMWLAETGFFVEHMLENRPLSNTSDADDDDDDEVEDLNRNINTDIHSSSVSVSEKTHLLRRKGRRRSRKIMDGDIDPLRYEVVDLVGFFVGRFHKVLYQISLLSLMYIGLLAYSQVFCNSIAAFLPNQTQGWMAIIPQLIFGSVVVPLSCMDLDEQVSVQALMAVVRFAAIFIMVAGSVSGLVFDVDNVFRDIDGKVHHYEVEHEHLHEHDVTSGILNSTSSIDGDVFIHAGHEYQHSIPYFAPAEKDLMSYTVCFSGFGVAFSTALFSQLFQHSVPGLLRPLRGQSKRIEKVPQVFGASLLTTTFFYLILGTSAASYFGSNTQSSVNLNFVDFSFGLDPKKLNRTTQCIIIIASRLVVMFPALDTLSVFPLIANTLGNNLLASSGTPFVKATTKLIPLVDFISSTCSRAGSKESLPTVENDRMKMLKKAAYIASIFWRLIAAIPPLIGSIWVTDLSFSFLLAGVAGLYVAFFVPCFIYLRIPQDHEHNNVYTGWYSQRMLPYPILAFATFALGVVLFQIREALQE